MGGLIGMGLASLPRVADPQAASNDVGPRLAPQAVERIGAYLEAAGAVRETFEEGWPTSRPSAPRSAATRPSSGASSNGAILKPVQAAEGME